MNAAEALLLLAVLLGCSSILWSSLRLGIGPVPTSPAVRDALIASIPLDAKGLWHEFGAGWGGVAFALARARPGIRLIAWEASPVPFLFLRLRLALAPIANLELRRADFLTAELGSTEGVVCYLFRAAMARLAVKFAAELPGGALIVSNTFSLPDWKPESWVDVPGVQMGRVWRYRKR